jgi:hypothetical protein
MKTATAQAYSDIRFRQPVSEFIFEPPPVSAEDEIASQALPSDEKLGTIEGPVAIAAKWITTIERRIQQSVPDPIAITPEEEGWLDSDIAARAVSFFSATSDVLPATEPYLYKASNGDLVAEFAERHGKLTNVIGKTAVNSFAVLDGQIVKTTMSLPFDNVLKARQELMQLTTQLRTGAHGIVEA